MATIRPSFLQAATTAASLPQPSLKSNGSGSEESFGEIQQIRQTIDSILTNLYKNTNPSDLLKNLVNLIRNDLEPVGCNTPASAGFRRQQASQPSQSSAPTRNFQSSPQNVQSGWRTGVNSPTPRSSGGAWQRSGSSTQSFHRSSVPSSTPSPSDRNSPIPFGTSHSSYGTKQNHSDSVTRVPPPSGRYQSRFKANGNNLQDKILNTIIGNKLNTFSPVTYNDVRDFIYQILDSGETEFIQDFVAKVFHKATQEDIYCALFAKFLAEISSRYSIIRDVMASYHTEFLKVFDDVNEGNDVEYEILVKKKQYRMGYGQFMSDLAALNTLDPACLYAMTDKILEGILTYTKIDDKAKLVEEFIDCYVRMMKALKQKNVEFFHTIRPTLSEKTIPTITPFIDKTAGHCPSLTPKARFGLMDLKDIIGE